VVRANDKSLKQIRSEQLSDRAFFFNALRLAQPIRNLRRSCRASSRNMNARQRASRWKQNVPPCKLTALGPKARQRIASIEGTCPASASELAPSIIPQTDDRDRDIRYARTHDISP
jgi:hypothetical protein